MDGRNTVLYPLMVIAALSVTLLSMLGIAAMTGHLPDAFSHKAAAGASCAECGVVASVRRVEPGGMGAGPVAWQERAKRVGRNDAYEITVRMDDGTTRTVTRRDSPTLGVGQRVRVVDGDVVTTG